MEGDGSQHSETRILALSPHVSEADLTAVVGAAPLSARAEPDDGTTGARDSQEGSTRGAWTRAGAKVHPEPVTGQAATAKEKGEVEQGASWRALEQRVLPAKQRSRRRHRRASVVLNSPSMNKSMRSVEGSGVGGSLSFSAIVKLKQLAKLNSPKTLGRGLRFGGASSMGSGRGFATFVPGKSILKNEEIASMPEDAGLLKISSRMSSGKPRKPKQLTFYLKKSDDDRLAQRSIHIGKQLGQLLMRYWLELKLLFCVYEGIVITFRLVMWNRHWLNDDTCWLCESSSAMSNLPVLDLIADCIFTAELVLLYRVTKRESLKQLEQLRSNQLMAKAGEVANYSYPLMQFLLSWPFLVDWLLVVPIFWALNSFYAPTVLFWTTQLLRLPRVMTIMSYFNVKELDNSINISTLATAKFVLMIFLAMHWIGCLFYFLAIVASFDDVPTWQSWVPQFIDVNTVSITNWDLDVLVTGGSMSPAAYLLCVYKGLNMLTNLGYEGVSPRRYEELVASVVVIFVQMVIEAYILGTLFHYLVKPDPLEEAFTMFMQKVDQYCKARRLPSALHKRVRDYFAFQHKKRRQDDSSVAAFLPHTLRVSISSHLYGHLLRRNRFLFGDCNPQFSTMLLMELREVFIMPGGIIFHMGDMARELCFVTDGVVEKVKDGKVQSVMYGVTDSASMLGEVAFLMSVPHPYMAQAHETSSTTLLTLSRAAFDKLLAPYPEAYEQIMNNLLEEYGMDRKGTVQHANTRSMDESVVAERQAMIELIQGALAQRNADSMGSVKYAISVADMDGVHQLLSEGFDVTSTDYDGRNILHLAAIAGDVKIVEMLVTETNAAVTAVDRWGRMPLDDALAHSHTAVVNFLRSYMGSGLNGSRYIRELCYGAAEGDEDLVMRSLHNGIDPNATLYDMRTPLHIAAGKGHLKVAEFLLAKGAAINAEDSYGRTPLEDSVLGGHELVAHLLRFNGAKLGKKIRSNQSHAAMHLMSVVSEGNISKAKLLIENGISPDVYDYDLRTSIHISASDGMLLTVAFLVEKCNCEINPVDRWDKTPMQDALEAGHMEVAILLRANGGVLGPSGDNKLLQLFDKQDLPTVQAVKKQVNRTMRRQLETNAGLRDLANQDHGEQQQRVLHLLIPEVGKVNSAVRTLSSALQTLDKHVGPTLLMLQTVIGSGREHRMVEPVPENTSSQLPKSSHRQALTADADSSIAGRRRSSVPAGMQKSMVRRKTVTAGGTRRGTSSIRDQASPHNITFVKTMLTFSKMANSIAGLHRAFLECNGDLWAKIADFMHNVGVSLDEKTVDELAESTGAVAGTEMDQDSSTSTAFYHLLALDSILDIINANSDPAATRMQQADMKSVKDLMEHLQGSWKLLSPEGDSEIRLEDLSAGILELLDSGFQAMRSAMQELGYGSDTLMNKGIFLEVMLYLVGASDPFDDSDAESQVSQSETTSMSESVAGGDLQELMMGIEGGTAMAVASMGNQQSDAQIISDEVKEIMRDAMEAIAAHDEWRARSGLQGRILTFIKQTIMREPSMEQLFAAELFYVLDEDGSELIEDGEMEVFMRVLKAKLKETTEKESKDNSHGEHMREHQRIMTEIFQKVEQLRDMKMTMLEFIKFCQPILHIDKIVSEKLKKAAQASTVLPVGTSRLVLHPHATGVMRWRQIMWAVAVYFFIDVPFRIAFHSVYCFGDWYVDISIAGEVLQIADLVRRFHTAYVNKNSVLITDLKKVRRHFLAHGFFWHLLASVPVDLLMVAASGFTFKFSDMSYFRWMQPAVSCWFRVPRMLLILDVFRCWQEHIMTSTSSLLGQALKRLLPLLFALSHCMACAWWMVGSWTHWEESTGAYHGSKDSAYPSEYVHEGEATGRTSWTYLYTGLGFERNIMAAGDCITQYCLSFYWVTATLATNGLVAGMLPSNWMEIGFTCVTMLISLTLYAYVLGEISNVVMKADEALVHQRSQLSLVQSFVKGRKLPQELKEAIVHQFESSMMREEQSALDESKEVFEKLSHSLQVEVARHVSRGLVGRVQIMELCKENFLDALSVLLKEQVMTRDGYLFRANEVCEHLYIIWKGAIEFVVEEEEELIVTKTSEAGCVVGELSFFFGMKQAESARSKLHSPGASLFVLKQEDFKELARLYPQQEQLIVKKVLAMYKNETNNMVMNSSNSNHLAEVQRSMEAAEAKKHQLHVVDMITAAADGDLSHIKSALKEHGLAVDEADYHGRTALHLSAANGHTHIVHWLVGVMNADVQVADIIGMTPLMEAVKNKHHEVARYLRQRRGTLGHNDLEEACEMVVLGKLDDIKLLVENGFNIVRLKDYDQRSALHLAASKGHLELVKFLVGHGMIPNVQDKYGNTPLQDAMMNGHSEVAGFLRSVGASIFSGETAYMLCSMASIDDMDSVKSLQAVGVDCNLADYDSRTALHLAACMESVMVATFFFALKNEAGQQMVNINVQDRYGNTPLDDAIRHGSKVMESMLRRHNAKLGSDPDLVEPFAREKERQKAAAEASALALAKDSLFQTQEMVLSRYAANVAKILTELSDSLRENVHVFHHAARDLVRAAAKHKPWGASQLLRLRRLSNAARQVVADKKTVDQEVGMMMRRTNNLNLHFLCGEKKLLRSQVLGMQQQLKQLVTQMDTFITQGRKVQFRFEGLRARRNRMLLNLAAAVEAYADRGQGSQRQSSRGGPLRISDGP